MQRGYRVRSCPERVLARLPEYAGGEMDSGRPVGSRDRELIESHLARCSECREEIAMPLPQLLRCTHPHCKNSQSGSCSNNSKQRKKREKLKPTTIMETTVKRRKKKNPRSNSGHAEGPNDRKSCLHLTRLILNVANSAQTNENSTLK